MSGGVLIAEDELIVAIDIETIVEEAGFSVADTCETVTATLAAIERALPACAVLDVRLLDGEVYPAADALSAAGVPLIFHSGHADEANLRERYPQAQVCPKPSSPSTLRAALARAME
ncbi:response regulator [Novosphingobium sp. YJ-S2-02]|uniref:Response regulator n=1 Tax=Novosphingobium aureum TaxID=2792964 RepID=A0A931MKL1_9SPHN|nr:response regulator [Novosphingobium aureum]MBH0112585.1 response regulator [Novosphingobium aureum]